MTRNEFLAIATEVKNKKGLSWQHLADELQSLPSIGEKIKKEYVTPINNLQSESAYTQLQIQAEYMLAESERSEKKIVDALLAKNETLHDQLRELYWGRYQIWKSTQKNKGGAPKKNLDEKKSVIRQYDLFMRNNGATHERALKQLGIHDRTLSRYRKDTENES